MAKKTQEVSYKNKLTGIVLMVLANIALSTTISYAVVDNYIKSNPAKIIESLQNYSEKKSEVDAKEAVENAKKLEAEVKANKSLPFFGNPNGTKIIVEFFDYNCGYCRHTFPEIMKLIQNDAEIKVVMKELPILGASSELASKAALAVHAKQPEKYPEFHARLMQLKEPKTQESILLVAKEAGINFDLMKEMQNSEYQTIIEANRDLAQSLGISGTPSFIVSGKLIPGAVDAATLEKILNSKKPE